MSPSEREPVSHAEFSRFVHEAREQRVRADAAELTVARLLAALTPENVGEGMHTALRKGCEGGMIAHTAIADMPPDQWRAAVEFLIDGLLHNIPGIVRVPS